MLSVVGRNGGVEVIPAFFLVKKSVWWAVEAKMLFVASMGTSFTFKQKHHAKL